MMKQMINSKKEMNKYIFKKIKNEVIKDIILTYNGFCIVTEKYQVNIFYNVDTYDCFTKVNNNTPNVNFKDLYLEDIHLNIECRSNQNNELNTRLVFIITMKNNINININIEIESQIFLSHNIKTALYNVKYHNTERFGYCRRQGFERQKFQPCTNAQ